ncbi:hypothetical protein [Streptomyces sp. NPDC017529]
MAVLAEVLTGLGEHVEPCVDEVLLRYAGHSDARVRGAVAFGLSMWQ